jgi:membrane protein implicated in regulation of membrane protease activity
MEFQASTLWWVLAGALVIAELLTGTFYLLMLALGSVAAAVAAHAGATGSGQFVAAALVGGGATAAWHFKRARAPRSAPAASNADVSPDIGQTVQVQAWQDDGKARVPYRGASWTVRHAGAGEPTAGEHRIVAVHGSELDVVPVDAAAPRA